MQIEWIGTEVMGLSKASHLMSTGHRLAVYNRDQKDLPLALDEAAQMHLALPAPAIAHQFYEAVRANGGTRMGTQVLILALERLNGIK